MTAFAGNVSSTPLVTMEKQTAQPLVIEHSEGSLWVPAYTKPRCEKVVHTYCDRHGIACYLPLMRRAERYQRRTVETFLPMFRSYVFVQINDQVRPLLLRSHKVLHFVGVTDEQEEVLIDELRDIQTMEAAQTDVELVVLPDLVPGQPVAITDGPFKGMRGIVERRRNRTRVTVNVDLLGQAVSAEIDIGEIAPDDD